MKSPESPPTGSGQPPPDFRTPAGNPWAWPTMWMVVTLSLLGGVLYVFRSCRDLPGEALDRTERLVNTVGKQLETIVAAFKQGSVTTSFTSYATTVSGSQFLQFATLSQHEVFTRRDQSSLLWGYVPLPEVIVEASAPVTFTYYLDLSAHWDFLLQDGVIYVTAPDIKYNKPAVDASRITYEVKKGSYLRDTAAAMEDLKTSITGLSISRAQTNIELVRETGRRQTEKFVQNWLARSFSDGKRYPVKVRFRKELSDSSTSILQHNEGAADPKP